MDGVDIQLRAATDDCIDVDAKAFYIEGRSDPDSGQFFFAYRICITNRGNTPARLVSRHWVITDGLGRVEEVRGAGVVGEQPRLKPGESFEYTSACPLQTQYGVMRGTYTMRRDDGTTFEAAIAPFQLVVPALAN